MTFETRSAFYRQMAVMLRSGLPLLTVLEHLAASGATPRVRELARALRAGVAAGEPLADLLGRCVGRSFSRFEHAVIRTGEASGMLAEVLGRLADHFAFLARIRSRLISGLLYPAILLHAAIVIPAVPLLVLKGPGRFLAAVLPGLVAIYGGAAVFHAARARLSDPRAAAAWDSFVLSLPVFGRMARTAALLRFLQSFVCLYVAGVGVVEAVELAAGTAGNAAIEEDLRRALPGLRRGDGVAASFAACRGLPPVVLDMLGTGEESGRMDETLGHVAEYFRQELETSADRVATILPVVVYLAVAGYVAFVVISFYSGYLSGINSLLE